MDSSRLLIIPDELNEILRRSTLCLIDTRAAEDFCRSHIPGAVHLDLFGLSLIDTRPGPLNAYLQMMRHLFEMRGVDFSKEVVLYENISGIRAARAFWFLDFFGHGNVRVLDGGFQAWLDRGFGIITEAAPPKPSRLECVQRREILATVDDVLGLIDRENACIIDTRSEDEYRGRNIRAARGGAIPRAIHVEWTRNLTAAGKFKAPDELKQLYEDLNVGPEKEVVAYCQGGYRSANTYLALKLMGYPKVRNYLGSWKEWGDRLDLPIVRP